METATAATDGLRPCFATPSLLFDLHICLQKLLCSSFWSADPVWGIGETSLQNDESSCIGKHETKKTCAAVRACCSGGYVVADCGHGVGEPWQRALRGCRNHNLGQRRYTRPDQCGLRFVTSAGRNDCRDRRGRTRDRKSRGHR